MAKQFGIIHFFGAMGPVTGYRDANGVARIRKSSSLDKERLHNDPKFAESRTAWPYLGMASKAGATIRNAMFPLIQGNKDRKTAARLVSICHRSLRHFHPEQTPQYFDFAQSKAALEGFAFKKEACISQYAERIATSEPDHESGRVGVQVSGWSIPRKKELKSGATHIRWRIIVAALPAEATILRKSEIIDSPWFPIEASQPWECEVQFAHYLSQDSQAILGIALESAQYVNRNYSVLQTIKALNILKIIS